MKITIHTDGGGLPTKPSIRQWFRNMANGISVSRNKDVEYGVIELNSNSNNIFRKYMDQDAEIAVQHIEIDYYQQISGEIITYNTCNYLN